MNSLDATDSVGHTEVDEPEEKTARDYIEAVDELLAMCEGGEKSSMPDDYVGQVSKVKGHIHAILNRNDTSEE